MEALLERLVLTVGKRVISESEIRNMLDNVYPTELRKKEKEKTSDADEFGVECRDYREYNEYEDELIAATLHRYAKNRTLTAKALGMSKTTLWRKMKKYGID